MISYLRAQGITLIYDPDEHTLSDGTYAAVPVTLDRKRRQIKRAEPAGRTPTVAGGRAWVTLQLGLTDIPEDNRRVLAARSCLHHMIIQRAIS